MNNNQKSIIAIICSILTIFVFCSCLIVPDVASITASAVDNIQVVAEPTPDKIYTDITTAFIEVSEPVETKLYYTEEEAPEPCPVTYEEIVMLAQTLYEEGQVVYWNGTKWSVSYQARQAGVGWCALNRLDDGGFGSTLAEILSEPYQFAWKEDAPVTEEMLWLAEDIIDRWWSEKQGEQNVGRTLPPDYLFFSGDGRENYFRQTYEGKDDIWDWSLPDPYLNPDT